MSYCVIVWKRLFKMPYRFSNEEYADMHFIYGYCNGSARQAVTEYRHRFPNRRVPHYRTFMEVHRQFRECGLRGYLFDRRVNLPADLDEQVLDAVTADPTISVRRISRQFGIPITTVWRILKREGLHPYHYQKVQCLLEADHNCRIVYSTWILRQSRQNFHFYKTVLWTDEASFTRHGILNLRNLHRWERENPKAIRTSKFQHEFSVNVWAGLIDNLLLGPFILPMRLNADNYLQFLNEELPTLLEDVPLIIRRDMWLQMDGAPAHFGIEVRNFLNNNYPRWIGRGGRVAWPPRSPDLNPLDFYFWGTMKTLVYAQVSNTRDELLERIRQAAQQLRENFHEVRSATSSIVMRAQACIQQGGGHFENIIN